MLLHFCKCYPDQRIMARDWDLDHKTIKPRLESYAKEISYLEPRVVSNLFYFFKMIQMVTTDIFTFFED